MSALDGIDGLLAACGGPSPVRLMLSAADGDEHDYEVSRRPFLILGRSAQCDIQLTGSDVSHRHAYIQMIGQRIFCADLGSRTGVHWHDGVRPYGWVALREHIAIGQYGLRFGIRPGEVAAVQEPPPRVRPEVSLRFLNGRINTDRSRQWQIRRKVTLMGHLPRCHIPLQDASVSRVHASLLRTASGLWVIDLLGKEGVEVNGERVAFARLGDTDVLQIGRFRMLVEHSPGVSLHPPEHEVDDAIANGRQAIVSSEAFPPSVYHSLPAYDVSRDGVAEHDLARPRPANGYQDSQRPLVSGGLSEEFVLSLLNQSASMQQQMVTQQNQMMLLTMQMLSAMHSHHTQLVREELDSVQALTREIQQIQAKLAGLPTVSPIDQSQAAEAKPAPQRPQLMPPANTLPVVPQPPESQYQVARPQVAQPPESQRQVAHPKPGEPVRNGHPSVPDLAAKAAVRKGPEAMGDHPKARLEDADLQSRLVQRLVDLERERSGYWKKIVRVIMG